jgi:predicted nucleic acid-binding protein
VIFFVVVEYTNLIIFYLFLFFIGGTIDDYAHIEEVVERYAEIDAFSQGKLKGKQNQFSARNMGKNDIWIAATASIFNLELVTTDKDFNHLDKVYLELKLIDMNSI